MAVSDDALHQNEGSRAARPEPLPFLLFMCPVATTSATHQAHKFSSLLPHIDLTTASSKEPMNPYLFGACLCRAKIFQSQELRGRPDGTPKSGDLAGVAGVRAERSPVRAWGGDTAETCVSGAPGQTQSNDRSPTRKAPVAEKPLDQHAIDAHDEHSSGAFSATTMLLVGDRSFGSVCSGAWQGCGSGSARAAPFFSNEQAVAGYPLACTGGASRPRCHSATSEKFS